MINGQAYDQPGLRTWAREEKARLWQADQPLRPEQIPDTLEYVGEFGAELVLFLPFVTWLSQGGWLKERRIKTYHGMRCFYDDLDCREILEKHDLRTTIPIAQRLAVLPVKDELFFRFNGQSPYHLYPNLRRKFAALPLQLSIGTPVKPILVVHNKHNKEWRRDPINHISLDGLEAVFTLTSPTFHVVYIRHGIGPLQEGFSEDRSMSVPFEDRAVLAKHPQVLCFDDEYAFVRARGCEYDVNTFKNIIYSRCFHFISSQGGGANHMAGFSGSLLMVLHRHGSEVQWGYDNGYYGVASNPSPIVVVCVNERDLVRGLSLFIDSQVTRDRVFLPHATTWLLSALSPVTIAARRKAALAYGRYRA